MRIKINEINKLEGHISFQAALENGNVKEAKVIVEEGARLIEGILIGRDYSEAPIITSRICGICPVVHNLTSIKAMEDALDIKVSDAVLNLRKIMLASQIVQSHALHLYFCSLPDFFKMSDNFKLLKKFPKEGKKAITIRNFVNKVVEIIGGRAIHPINSVIGGFNVAPTQSDLKNLHKEAKELLKTAVELADFFENLSYPKLKNKTIYLSLKNKGYAFYDGVVSYMLDYNPLFKNGSNGIIKPQNFLEGVKEFESGNVTKRTKIDGDNYMVGALARINNNYSKLSSKAKKIFKRNKKELLNFNSFYNILAQAIELVHFMEVLEYELKKQSILKSITPAIHKPFKQMNQSAETTFKGSAICEAPRGILFHQYELDKNGKIKNCNIIAPTAQSLNNLEADMVLYLTDNKNFSPDKIKFLIRAYDPCISCATH
ncbi:Ni/Fe hydrogenase subunit alpha [Patescibacteria group bacterium]